MSYIKNKRVLHCIVNLGGSDGVPIAVNSELEMEKILFNANSEDYDKIYHYTGETTDNYEQGAYYIISEE